VRGQHDKLGQWLMKKFSFILVIFVAITFTVNAQWSLQTNPLSSDGSNLLGKIQFVSATEGWIACGSNGNLLHTINAGATWTVVTPFPNEQTGSMSDPAINMSWVNPTHGWAINSYGKENANGAVLYSTADGGNSWAKKELPATATRITYTSADLQGTWQFHVLTSKNPSNYASIAGWMAGTVTVAGVNCSVSVLRSDGTNRNMDISMTISSVGVISMNGEEHGFMSADKSTAIMTGQEDNDGYSMYVMQKQVAGTSYSTADFQGAWQMHGLSAGNSNAEHGGWAHAVLNGDAAGNLTGSFVGVGGGGTINMSASISSGGIITGLSAMSSDTHGFMSADKKSFYLTMTGSENGDFNLVVFQKQETGTTYTTADLMGSWQMQILTADCTNDYESFAYYAHGKINLDGKGDGKVSYFLSDSPTELYEDLAFSINSDGIFSGFGLTGSHGFMSADKSIGIGTSTDGNGTYSLFVMQKDLSVSGDMGLEVQFVDNNTGWVSIYNQSANNFKLYKTTDGGTTLNPLNNTVGGIFQFVDTNNGWMIGSTVNNVGEGNLNNIYHTTDGGSTWSEQATTIGKAQAIYFSDLLHGWVVGVNGLILKTIDGGTNWISVTNAGLSTESTCKTVFFLDANTGWIGTNIENTNGVGTQFILATKDGGSTWTTQSTPVTNDIFSISFWDANNGWLTGDYGQIAHYGWNVSTNDLYSSQKSIYPNPTNDGFFSDAGEKAATVSIYNMNGMEMLSKQVTGKTYIDISTLPQGLYIVKISTHDGTVEQKLVKK